MRSGRIAVVGLCVAPAFAGAEIVFNNFRPSTSLSAFQFDIEPATETDSTIEVPGGFESISRGGDVVTLGGAARLVNLFEVRLSGGSFASGTAAGAAEIILEIYTVSGGLPDALLWSGEKTVPVLPRDWMATDVAFAPNITVPNTIAWAVHFKNFRDSDRTVTFGHALDRATATLVGSSPATYIVQDSATGAWRAEALAFSNVDGVARISAVPAPGALSVLAMTLAARRRRR